VRTVPATQRQRNPERDDGPSDADIERFSDVTQKCPKCGTELYDDVEICWSCGHALTRSENPANGVWIAAVVGLIVLAFVLLQVL
jgi:hypothetical protein